MPSGKTLWLCEEHQHKSRVTVLEDDWEFPEHVEEPSVLEYKLLTKLEEIAKGVEEKTVADETGSQTRLIRGKNTRGFCDELIGMTN